MYLSKFRQKTNRRKDERVETEARVADRGLFEASLVEESRGRSRRQLRDRNEPGEASFSVSRRKMHPPTRERIPSTALIVSSELSRQQQLRALRNRARCETVAVACREETWRCHLAPDPEALKRNESPYSIPSGVRRQLPPVCSPLSITSAYMRVLILPVGSSPLMRVARRLDSGSSLAPGLRIIVRSITGSITVPIVGPFNGRKRQRSFFAKLGYSLITASNDRNRSIIRVSNH